MEDRGITDIMGEMKKTVIHQLQIPDHHWGSGKPTSKITEEIMMLDTDRDEI